MELVIIVALSLILTCVCKCIFEVIKYSREKARREEELAALLRRNRDIRACTREKFKSFQPKLKPRYSDYRYSGGNKEVYDSQTQTWVVLQTYMLLDAADSSVSTSKSASSCSWSSSDSSSSSSDSSSSSGSDY